MSYPSTVIVCWDDANECLLIKFKKKPKKNQPSQLKSGSVMVCLKSKSIFEHYVRYVVMFKI